ncbi:hypothetical protein BCR44DRAFT_1265496 [Catenaria anguillulae PL171]|uniref:Zn(2)-C6 fungal-type domain-containing protein n=1 Tax=Catenaria anguillulae PL171 TaxID=765915 RepID=A0A1Y2HAG4_9FUNG|nr:hypothetical protein BCR44DRAFT_1265496 [Catenaria anguillulae PL171]
MPPIPSQASSLALSTSAAPHLAAATPLSVAPAAPRHPHSLHASVGPPISIASTQLSHPSLALAHPSFSSGALFPSSSRHTMATPPRPYSHPHSLLDHGHQFPDPAATDGGGTNPNGSSLPHPAVYHPPHNHNDSHRNHYAYPDDSAQHRVQQQQQQQPDSMSDGDSFDGRDAGEQTVQLGPSSVDRGPYVGASSQQQTSSGTQHGIPGLVASKVPPRKRKRLTRACDTCRKRKIRCDGKHPCGPCVAYESACSYDDTIRKRVFVGLELSLNWIGATLCSPSITPEPLCSILPLIHSFDTPPGTCPPTHCSPPSLPTHVHYLPHPLMSRTQRRPTQQQVRVTPSRLV